MSAQYQYPDNEDESKDSITVNVRDYYLFVYTPGKIMREYAITKDGSVYRRNMNHWEPLGDVAFERGSDGTVFILLPDGARYEVDSGAQQVIQAFLPNSALASNSALARKKQKLELRLK